MRRGTPEYSEHQRRVHLAAWARIKAGEGFLYVAELAGADRIKIGFSLNPALRIKDPGCMHLCNGRGRLLATTPGSFAQEQALHRTLKAHRILAPGKNQSEIYPRSILSHEAIPQALQVAA